MSINSNLRQLRIDSGMTQEQAADKAGVTRQAISSYESGRTRPDIDMLMRLSAIYGTDLDGVLYGQGRALKSARLTRTTATVLAVLLTVLTAVSSALLWSANRFFAITEKMVSAEAMAVLAIRQRLTGAWKTMDLIILAVSFVGFMLLMLLIVTNKSTVKTKTRIVYIAALSACLLTVSAAFGLTDAVYSLTNYLITPGNVIARMLLLFAVTCIVDLVRKSRRGN